MLVVDDQIPHLAAALSAIDTVRAVPARSITNDLLRTTQATAVFVRSVIRVNADLLNGTNVTFVGTATAGVDHVDEAYLGAHNIRFASAPGCNANAVAEYVLDVLDMLSAPSNAVIGIIGMGHVGDRVARYACQRGMSVLVNDPPLLESGRTFPPLLQHVTLPELLQRADVVTLHVPLTHDGPHPTYGMLDADHLDMCRPNTLVINTSRGGVVDEFALAERVVSGRLHAVLDVYANEPQIDASIVERIPYCTPHIAGYTRQAKEKGASMVYEAYTGQPWPPIAAPASTQSASLFDADRSLMVRDFEAVRRLAPLREERRYPPTWEECHVARS